MVKLRKQNMIGKKLKQKLCLAGALGMAFLSLGITPVYAESDTAETEPVIDPEVNHTGEQYYFGKEAGVVFPDWGKNASKAESVIAVVGSGVDYTHADLKDVMWTDDEEVSSLKALGGGTNGYNADGITSADKIVSYDDPMDTTGTGTQAAGVIAASWDGKGISGALSGVKIMAVKATSPSAVESGLSYVLAAKEADINVTAIHLTLPAYTPAIGELITKLGEAGVITVIAAGDSGTNTDGSTSVSLLNNPYVITVGATDQNKKRWTGSNFGELSCDVFAPGEKILTTDITKPETVSDETTDTTDTTTSDTATAEGKSADTAVASPDSADTAVQAPAAPAVSNKYSYVSSTQMSAAIVTAFVSALQEQNSRKLDADVLAARILESAETIKGENDETFRFVNYANALKAINAKDSKDTSPLVNYAEIKEGNLIIHGYDFEAKKGSVKVGDTPVSGTTVWADNKITIKTDAVNPGIQDLEVIRNDKSATKGKVNILGESKTPDLPVEGLPNKIVTIAVLNDIPYAATVKSDAAAETTTTVFYRYDKEDQSAPWKAHGTYNSEVTDACADNEYIYVTDKTSVVKLKPTPKDQPDQEDADSKYGTMEVVSSVTIGGDVSDVRISKIGDDVIVSYTAPAEEGAAANIHIAKAQFGKTPEENRLVPVCELSDKERPSLRCLDVVKTDDKLYAVCVNTGSGEGNGEQLTVYELNDAEEAGQKTAELLFQEKETQPANTYSKAGAVSNGEVITVYGINESGKTVAREYDPADEKTPDKVLRTEPVTDQAAEHINGELDSKGNLYLAGTTGDGETAAPFIKTVQTGSKPKPEPTTPSTSDPTAPPTSAPTATPAPASKPTTPAPTAPVSTVVTCQDAGFPAGWYWNESKKACVAPMTPAPTANTTGGNRTTDGTDVRPGGNITPTATPTPEPTESAEPTATPEITPTPTPTATPEDIQPPMEIINTKGILWFLGIPVLMILTGLGVYLSKGKGLIPWLIAGDAIGSIVLAVLDHSIVGWILVVLNLAAIGLLALYRSGKQDEEDEEFEDE